MDFPGHKEKPAVVVRGSAWDLLLWSTGMVWLPLFSLSGEMAGDEIWCPVKPGCSFLGNSSESLALHVLMQCDLAVELTPVEVIQLISMEQKQVPDIILLSFNRTSRSTVMKQLCSGSCSSTYQVILRDFPNVLAVAITCSSTQLSCKAVALDTKPHLNE